MSHRRAKAIRKTLKKKGIEYNNLQYYSQAAGQPIFASHGRQDYQQLKKGIKTK
jgi:outer membrane protein OmpA-like peptidoglycan-associated protein